MYYYTVSYIDLIIIFIKYLPEFSHRESLNKYYCCGYFNRNEIEVLERRNEMSCEMYVFFPYKMIFSLSLGSLLEASNRYPTTVD